jgi:Domain of unknown function (DUF4157)/Bacterial toxin 44
MRSQVTHHPNYISAPAGGILQRKCASCGNHTTAGGKCEECEKQGGLLQRKSSGHSESSAAPPVVHDVLNSPGQPLDAGTRAFFEPRFGRDFSNVRVHADAMAMKSARVVNALAYTVGENIVFGEGQYVPHTAFGRRLIAHELTHSLQQTQGGNRHLQGKLRIGSATDVHEQEADRIANSIMENQGETVRKVSAISGVAQRACGAAEIGEPEGCEFSASEVDRPRYLFQVNCDEFATGNELDLRADAMTIVEGETIDIHGLASIDGDPDFNLHLSCARALRAKTVIEEVLASRGITATIRVFHHGGIPGDATQQRSVVLVRTAPPPPAPERRCGPDATDWFIRQVSAAKTDRIILALQSRLSGAERVARSFGFSAERIAEGAVARKVLAEEARVGSPTRTTEASAQITASVPGQREFGRAVIAATVPIAGAPEAAVLAAIRGSALTWKGLVGTGMKYDFKNSARTLQSPTSANCPVDCANTITLCPTTSSDCFVKDVPGNLFYAHVGRFVGWTELALQLGSQFAQLESSASWDPPEDTRMINFGFGLPDPLTRSDLCSAINANRSVFDLQNCSNCAEEVTADVV